MNAFGTAHRIPQALRAVQGEGRPTTRQGQEAVLREVSRSFVGFFMGELLKSMRSTVKLSDLGHGGSAEQIFQGLADDEIAMEAARSEAYGLSELVYQGLLAKSRPGVLLRRATEVSRPLDVKPPAGSAGTQRPVADPNAEQGKSHE